MQQRHAVTFLPYVLDSGQNWLAPKKTLDILDIRDYNAVKMLDNREKEVTSCRA